MVKYTRLWGDNAEKRHQPVSPDQDIWNQQWSVEQAAEELYISTHTVETLCRILDCRVEGCDGDRVR